MEREKSCKNCRYYLAHYVKTSLGFTNTTCGHCTHNYKNLPKEKVCDKWDSIKNAIPDLEMKMESRFEKLQTAIENIRSLLELLKEIYGN